MRNRRGSEPTQVSRRERSSRPRRRPAALRIGGGLLALLCAAAAPGCAGDETADDPSGTGAGSGTDRGRPADGLYDRELAFLAVEGRRALLFTSRADIQGGAGRVHASAWADIGGGWEELVDETREFAELRDPWRIFPLGPTRLVVDEEGSLAEISVPGPRGAFLLRPTSPPMDMPRSGARISVREASLSTPDDSIRGLLVDAMVAFPAADSAGSALHGVFTAVGGPIVVIAGGENGGSLLVADMGGEELLETEVRIEAGDRANEWRVVSADTSVVGTLRASADGGPAAGVRPIAVEGRIALAGTLHPLAGVLLVPVP
jgi:hypothetical protein